MLNCFHCNNDVFQSEHYHSKLSLVPLGLDRPHEVLVNIHECNQCGSITLTDYKGSVTQDMYIESACFDASVETSRFSDIMEPYSSQLISKALVHKLRHTRVLDFGCGAGYYTQYLRDVGIDAFGIDLDPKAINHLRDRNIEAYVGGVEALNKHTFNHIICIGVIEHFTDPRELLHKFYQQLPVGGSVILAYPNINSFTNWIAKRKKLPWDMYCEPGHFTFYSNKAIRECAVDLGFDFIKRFTSSHIGRGKFFLSANRDAQKEAINLSKVGKSKIRQFTYPLFPKFLDICKIGDINVIQLRKN